MRRPRNMFKKKKTRQNLIKRTKQNGDKQFT